MTKVLILVHMVLSTAIVGALIVAVVSVPSLYDQGMKLIPIVAAIGFVASIPLSLLIARRIMALTHGT